MDWELSNSNTISIMGKVTSLYGKTTGKIGSIVFSTSGGENIAREYNPHVANPNTQAQVNQRARMKLMSQLSAVLDPVIAMQKEGLVSKRNKFVSRNFGLCYVSNGEAQISYENLQLTTGNAAIPAIVYEVDEISLISTLKLSQNAQASVSRVCYIIFRKTSEGLLQLVKSQIVETAGTDGLFPWEIGEIPADNYVFFAYGMKDLSAKATAHYGNLQVSTANDLATLIASRTLSTADYQFTQTRGASSNGGAPIEPVPEGKFRVYVTANGPGSVSGGGLYDEGADVTVIATPSPSCNFLGWYQNGSNLRLSESASYTFKLIGLTDLVAKFEQGSL